MSIREVARRAGVGIGTVSRVLNGHPSVRPEVRQRVLDMVKALGYVPNVHAQRMWKRKSNTICFLLSNREILLSLHGHIFRGVEEFAARNGYSVLFSTFKYSAHERPEALDLPQIMRSRGLCDGVVLGGVNHPNLLERMHHEGILFSLFGNNFIGPDGAESNSVRFDDESGAELAVEYLIRLGHRDIWFVGDTSWPWNRRRHDRYVRVMQRHGYEPRAMTLALAQKGHELGLRAAPMILEKPCTAIFAASDYIASGVIEAAQTMGCQVPRDLSVIGFDAADEFVYYRPSITTVGTDKEQVGQNCALMLIRQIESGVPAQPSVVLPMQLIERDSCMPRGQLAARHARSGKKRQAPVPR